MATTLGTRIVNLNACLKIMVRPGSAIALGGGQSLGSVRHLYEGIFVQRKSVPMSQLAKLENLAQISSELSHVVR